MGYLHIDNLYKSQEILLFKRCYALEKIHGTSTHISWNEGRLGFFAGGESHERFKALFDSEALTAKFVGRFTADQKVIVYGEGYGGKCQGMKATYGADLRFVAFDVVVGDCWLSVPQAAALVTNLGLEFVDFAEVATDVSALDAERDKDSTQAIRNGCGTGHIREGVVLRPLIEVTLNNGQRVIVKHKRAEFAERATIPDIDPAKREINEKAEAIADEWVVPMRLRHVLDKLPELPREIQSTGKVIAATIEDVTREAAGEIADNDKVRRAIGHRTAILYKKLLAEALQ